MCWQIAVLASLSILPFVALPLTGLSYELKQGFHPTNRHPSVIGLNWDNINSVTGAGVAASLWSTGTNATIPGLGVIYTPPGVDRSQQYFKDVPNSLPVNEGLKDAFITAQAEAPISGSSWGLALNYNCSVVTKLSDFTILNHRSTSAQVGDSYYPTDNNNTYIKISNVTDVDSLYALNYEVVMEEGIQYWPPTLSEEKDTIDDSCYYWDHNDGGSYPGLDKETVYEAILWQNLDTTFITDDDSAKYNLTVDYNITELYGAWQAYVVWDADNQYYSNMTAVGVQCKVSSAVGSAKIDGRTSTYTDFNRTDTPIPPLDTCSPRMDVASPGLVVSQANDTNTFITNIFRSINAPLQYTANYITDLDPQNVNKSSQEVQLYYLQAADLQHALLRTYPAYVNELIFNGGLEYSNASGVQYASYINTNVTSFEVKKIFETGDIKFWIPGALLLVWAIGSVGLTLMYGFRRRWSSTLDGYSMFRFGADLAERVRDRPEFGVNMGFEDCYLLREIPGLIGDANLGFEPGHITLVQGKEALADKNKLYM